jgi:hypothetical protein
MRLTREQIERMCAALDQTAADWFHVDVLGDGKMRFYAIETVEKKTPIRLTPRKKATA